MTILPAISILCQQVSHRFAEVAEQADAHDSKSCGEIRVGSTPTFGTASLPQRVNPYLQMVLMEPGCVGECSPVGIIPHTKRGVKSLLQTGVVCHEAVLG